MNRIVRLPMGRWEKCASLIVCIVLAVIITPYIRVVTDNLCLSLISFANNEIDEAGNYSQSYVVIFYEYFLFPLLGFSFSLLLSATAFRTLVSVILRVR